jgi:hypothetical protein
LYNAATVATLALALLCGYAAVFVLVLGISSLLIDDSTFRSNVGHHAGLGDYVALAWLAASIATVAGALGSGLESIEEVRHAAYGHNQRRRDRRQGGSG